MDIGQDGTEQAQDKSAISKHPKGGHQGTTIRTNRYRHVEWHDKAGKLADRELYDHQTDPRENQNVADKPEDKAIIARLAAELAASLDVSKAR